jgi:glycosyltransferase involved in cell wall biosynthesis
VLIPSFRRPVDLARCLTAIKSQSRAADEVLVVNRIGDQETAEIANGWRDRLPVKIVVVSRPGVVHAMQAGLAMCTGEVVAITDDDAAPRADWLARIETHFVTDPKLGGVGGRDWVHAGAQRVEQDAASVGVVTWFGKVVGNHHLGVGQARQVDVLKGVNCSFRVSAIAPIGFDTRLKGEGAQVHWEMCLCFAVKRAGWRLVYDPAVAVDHYPAPRFDRDRRDRFDPRATWDRAYNFRLALGQLSPWWKRVSAFAWHYAVGTRDEPGLLNLVRLLGRRDPDALVKFRAARGFLHLEAE